MNIYFTLFVVAAIAASTFASMTEEELRKKLNETYEICRTKTGITKAQMNKIGMVQVPTDKESQCFLACSVKKLGLMADDNKFNKDAIMKLLEPLKDELDKDDKISFKKVESLVGSCIAEVNVSSDECLTAKNGMECIITTAKKEGILP